MQGRSCRWKCGCLSVVAVLMVLGGGADGIPHLELTTESSDLNKPENFVQEVGVVGDQVRLPCPTKAQYNDSVRLVLWYKGKGTEPIYSFDVRKQINEMKQKLKEAKSAGRWSSPKHHLRDRAYFEEKSEPAHLIIVKLEPKDEGIYKCRVDFVNSPTTNYMFNLTIIEPPGKPVIQDGDTRQALTGVRKVYNEGSRVTLICKVKGGKPPPRLIWFHDNQEIGKAYKHDPKTDETEHYITHTIRRQDQDSQLVCQAWNSDRAVAQSAILNLEVNLKPTDVNIVTKEPKLVADRKYELECRSTGSKPNAVITWWMANRRIDNRTESYTENNQSVSILKFVPSIENEGKYLTCRAENPNMQDSAIEDRLQLNVQYKPVVSLKMGTNLNPDVIKEGEDVYFDCNVTANPKAYKLSWFKDMKEMRNNQSAGIVLSDHSLVLRGVTRNSAGSYTCVAVNSEGKTHSNPVPLRVMYAPVCKEGKTELVVGALKQETVSLLCSVESHPEPLTFHWTFNNSGEPIDMPASSPSLHQQRISNSHGISSTSAPPTAQSHQDGAAVLKEYHGARMNYTPSTEMDYGTVACWASNHVGRQRSPCLFQVIAAGRPSALHNCTATEMSPGLELGEPSNNVPSTGLLVSCLEGYNGGLPIKSYHVDVISDDEDGSSVILNKTVESSGAGDEGVAKIEVAGLSTGRSYRLYLYALNAKGRSEPTVLEPVTLKGVAMYTTGNADISAFSPLLLGLAATATLLALAVAGILAALYRKHSGGLAGSPKHAPIVCEPPNPGSTTPVHPQTKPLTDDKDPDLIPNEYERRPLTSVTPTVYKTPPAQRRRRENNRAATIITPSSEDDPTDKKTQPLLEERVLGNHHPGFAPRTTLAGTTNTALGYNHHHLPSVPDFKQIAYEQFNRNHQNVYYSLQRATASALSAMPPVQQHRPVTSALSPHGKILYHQEVVTRSNKIQESCI